MEKNNIITITRTIIIKNQDIDDIMCSALEGGINYWAAKAEVIDNYLGEYGYEQIAKNGKLAIHLIEPFDEKNTIIYELTKEKFLHGVKRYLEDPYRSYDILDYTPCNNDFNYETEVLAIDTSNADAVVADMIIQYALFDETVFG